jgi:hypothetical protein
MDKFGTAAFPFPDLEEVAGEFFGEGTDSALGVTGSIDLDLRRRSDVGDTKSGTAGSGFCGGASTA